MIFDEEKISVKEWPGQNYVVEKGEPPFNLDRTIVAPGDPHHTGLGLLLKDKSEAPPRGGWAPGHYLNICHRCDRNFIGDKRALNCSRCAYKNFGTCLRCGASQVKLSGAYLGRDGINLGTCETCLTIRPYGRTLLV